MTIKYWIVKSQWRGEDHPIHEWKTDDEQFAKREYKILKQSGYYQLLELVEITETIVERYIMK